MKFPRRFDCMGHTIRIRYYKKLKNLGEYWPDKDLIKILKRDDMSQDQILATIYHEVAHVWMMQMGMEALYKDEQFVDILGSLMLQYLKSNK